MTANGSRAGARPSGRAEEVTGTTLRNATGGIEATFDEAQLLDGLRRAGIESGETVFVQVSLDALGRANACASDDEVWAMLLRALREAVGETGTLLVPTYTFSFCRQEDFDVASTPTAGGPWSTSAGFLEFFRRCAGCRALERPDPFGRRSRSRGPRSFSATSRTRALARAAFMNAFSGPAARSARSASGSMRRRSAISWRNRSVSLSATRSSSRGGSGRTAWSARPDGSTTCESSRTTAGPTAASSRRAPGRRDAVASPASVRAKCLP